MKTIIKNGTIVTDTDVLSADLLLEGEKIVEVAPVLEAPGARELDAAGKLVFPGFIDAHTHFDLPVSGTVTADDFESGSACALLGGTTTVVDFATQDFGESLEQARSNWHQKADGKASCDYAFHMAISQWTPQVRDEMEAMVRAGISSFTPLSDRMLVRLLSARGSHKPCRARTLRGAVPPLRGSCNAPLRTVGQPHNCAWCIVHCAL